MPIFHVQPSGDPVSGWLVPGGDFLREHPVGFHTAAVVGVSCDRWNGMNAAQKRAAVIDWLSHHHVGTFGESNILNVTTDMDANCSFSGTRFDPWWTQTPAVANLCPPVRRDQFRPVTPGVLCPDPISIPDLLAQAKLSCDSWRALTWGNSSDINLSQAGKVSYAWNMLFGGYGHRAAASLEIGMRQATALAHAIDAYCLGQGIREIGEAKAQNTAVKGSTKHASGAVSREQVILGRFGMTCRQWQAQSKDPAVRARRVQHGLGVSEAEAAQIRDALDAYCRNSSYELGAQSEWPSYGAVAAAPRTATQSFGPSFATAAPKTSVQLMAASGAVQFGVALPWLGGAAIGSALTYLAMRKSKR